MSNLLSPLSGGATEPTDQFLLKLESHWTNDVGLRKSTRRRYLPTIRRFLGSQFVDAALKCQQFRRFRRPFRWSSPLIRHTTTPAGAWERTRRPADPVQGDGQSAQSRTLRAVSGNWSYGTSVSFRLQADLFEGQVKFSGVIADTRFKRPQRAG